MRMRWTTGPRFQLLQRRTVWSPTRLGWCLLFAASISAFLWSFLAGESFLSATQRLPGAEVLVVEGWIGRDAVRAAAFEFEQNGYEYVAASGGPTSGRWEKDPSNYAAMAGLELMELGIPSDKIIVAPCKETESNRTFESAAAVARALAAKHLHPKALNVFTYGPHARRSRLVFAKVFHLKASVGMIAWKAPDCGRSRGGGLRNAQRNFSPNRPGILSSCF